MRHLLFPGLIVVLAACGDPGATSSPAAEVTDSAGIRVVTTPPGDAVYAELAEEPALSIGDFAGPEEILFGDIESVARDVAGNLVVADDQALQIRVFDPEGNHLRSLGREGEGPGEFESLQGAWPVEDGGILAVDFRDITLFGADGTPVRTGRLLGPDRAAVLPIGLSGPGVLLSSASPYRFPTAAALSAEDVLRALLDDLNPPTFFIRHRLADGILIDTVAEWSNHRMAPVSSGERRDLGGGRFSQTVSMQIPFAPRSAAAGSPHGVAFTGGVDFEIDVFDGAGSLRIIARLDEAPPVLTDAHLEAYATSSGTRERTAASIRRSIESYRELPLPGALPGYMSLLIADTGEIWALRYAIRGARVRRWDIFAADGVYLGRVAVPASFRVEEVSRGQDLGVATDELGVERVQIRELTLK
ncbi:MAG: hypothetical protein F4Z32_09740 [Gemmatimonadetes bacterium]|nr:hypothetical protein [Gemmatimonadota bacterium]